jgi:hypothetical protein
MGPCPLSRRPETADPVQVGHLGRGLEATARSLEPFGAGWKLAAPCRHPKRKVEENTPKPPHAKQKAQSLLLPQPTAIGPSVTGKQKQAQPGSFWSVHRSPAGGRGPPMRQRARHTDVPPRSWGTIRHGLGVRCPAGEGRPAKYSRA